MKLKRFATLLAACMLLMPAMACGDTMKDDSLTSDSGNSSVVEDSGKEDGLPNTDSVWYEEKSGYKFCGYYEDANFTNLVTETVTQETAKNYYPKYQLDRVQQLAAEPTKIEHTIYALDVFDAVRLYLWETYEMELFVDEFDRDLTKFGITDISKRGFQQIVDNNETIPHDYQSQMLYCGNEYGHVWNVEEEAVEYKYRVKGNTCRIHTPDELETYDGWVYSVVNHMYAVVYGRTSADEVESLSIPSFIRGYPVREVSMLYRMRPFQDAFFPKVKNLTIPFNVQNVMLNDHSSFSDENLIENLIVEEGVKTVRLSGGIAKNISLPSTAYDVDFNMSGMRSIGVYCVDQSITIAENGHYFTENGCLYSKEGDLCFQFANRGSLDLKPSEKTKRILPMSINGIAKNIYIPEGVEYFDWQAFCKGLRDGWFENMRTEVQPMLLIDSPSVAERYLTETIVRMCFYDAHIPMPALYNKRLDTSTMLQNIWEILTVEYHLTFEEGTNIEEQKQAFLNGMFEGMEYEEDEETLKAYVIDGYKVFAPMDFAYGSYINANLCLDASKSENIVDDASKGVLRMPIDVMGSMAGGVYAFEVYTYMDTPLSEIEDLSFDRVVYRYAEYHGLIE